MLVIASMLLLAAAVLPAAASSDIEAPGPHGALKGTLTGEAGKDEPVVLIIPGSGPTDRDGNNPLGVKASSYKLLAEDLARRGLASVRIDKRGMFGSKAAVPDANDVTIDDYVRDTVAWVAAIRQRTGARCVWLLGHSEGGLVALATAAQSSTDICGLVLVSTPGRSLGDVLKEQLKTNPANAPYLAAAFSAIDALTAGRRVDVASPLDRLFPPAVQRFLISAFALDPAQLIKRAALPILILQGDRDIQVGMADAENLKAASPDATLVRLPGINHVLKEVSTDDRRANAATYADPNLPIAPGVGEAIEEFIATNRR